MDLLANMIDYGQRDVHMRDIVTELITFDNTQRRLEQAERQAYEFVMDRVYAV